MNRVVVAALLVTVTGCPGPENANPERVWLFTDVVETRVKLVEFEPPPF
jgi:hypothetical protein